MINKTENPLHSLTVQYFAELHFFRSTKVNELKLQLCLELHSMCIESDAPFKYGWLVVAQPGHKREVNPVAFFRVLHFIPILKLFQIRKQLFSFFRAKISPGRKSGSFTQLAYPLGKPKRRPQGTIGGICMSTCLLRRQSHQVQQNVVPGKHVQDCSPWNKLVDVL